MSRKMLLWLLPLVLVALGVALGYAPLERRIVHRHLLTSLEGFLGRPVSAESVTSEGANLVFSNVTVGGQSSYSLKVEQIKVSYALSFWQRRIDAEIEVVKPRLLLSRGGVVGPVPARHDESMGWWRPNLALKITDGEIFWEESRKGVPIAMVTADLEPGQHRLRGAVTIAVAGRGTRGIHLNIEEQGHKSAVALRLHSAPADLVSALAKSFLGLTPQLEVYKGSISGVVNLVSSSSSDGWQPNGQATLDEVIASVTGNENQLRIKEGKVTFEPSPGAEGEVIHAQGSLQLIAARPSLGSPLIWNLDGFKGHLTLETNGNVGLSCRGQWWHQGQVKAFRLDGKGNSFAFETAILAFIGIDGSEGRVEFSSNAAAGVTARVSRLDATEISFFKQILAPNVGALSGWIMPKGHVDGMLTFAKGRISIDELMARNVEIQQVPHGLSASAPLTHGNLLLDFDSKGAGDLISGELFFNDAELSYIAQEGSLGLSTDINGELTFGSQGLLQADLSGLFPLKKGSWGLRRGQDWQFQMAAQGDSVALFLPPDMRQRYMEVLGIPECALNIVFKRAQGGVFCQGDLAVAWPEEMDPDRLTFSCNLGSEALNWITGSSLTLWPEPIRDFFSHGSLLSRQTSVRDVGYRFPHQEGHSYTYVQQGAFEALGISLERYRSLISSELAQSLSGTADIRGLFASNQLMIDLDHVDAVLDHPLFRFEMKSAQVVPTDLKSILGDAGPVSLRLPFSGATFYDKTHQLLFSDIAGTAEYRAGRLTVTGLEAASEGLVFSGSLQSDTSTEFRLAIAQLSGSVNQLRRFLTHFDQGKGLIHRIPLEGSVTLGDREGTFIVCTDGSAVTCEASLAGQVTDARLSQHSGDVTLNELGMRFAYQYPANTLCVTDLQGTVLVGRPGSPVEEYRLAGDRILLHQYPGEWIEFDLWVGDKARDVIRATGEARAVSAGTHSLVHFAFDKENTHFGNVHPRILELTLRDWSQVVTFATEANFSLSTALRDLQRLSRTGLTGFSKRIIEELQGLTSAEGDFSVALAYDRAVPTFTYRLTGKDIKLYQHMINNAFVVGSVQGDNWILDNLRIDDLSFAADIQVDTDRWKINFLGMRAANAVTMGFEGDYYPDRGAVDGRVNLFEVSLGQLKNWNVSRRFAESYQPKGELRAAGNMTVTMRPSPEWCHIDGQFETLFRGVEIGGLRFKDAHRIATHFDSNRGLVLQDLRTALLPLRNSDKPVDLQIERVAYNTAHSELAVHNGHFQTGGGPLGWLADLLKAKWGAMTSQLLRNIADKVASKEGINGKFSFQLAPGISDVQLALDEGTYYYNQHPYTVKQLVASYNPYELRITSQFDYRGHPVWATLRNECPLSPYGQLFLSETSLNRQEVSRDHALAVYWEYDSRRGFGIQKAEGKLFGIEANLQADKGVEHVSPYPTLKGQVWIDVEKIAPILGAEFREGLERAGLHAKYRLDGKWQISSLLPEWVTFDGQAQAERWQIAGYLLDRFEASLELTATQIKMRNVMIEDAAGTLRAAEVLLSKEAGRRWKVSIPEVIGSDIVPVALNRPQEVPRKRRHDIVLPTFTLTNFTGEIGKASTFLGEGSARFTHATKKKAGKGLLGFTSELMSHIGFDVEVVTPASGIIEYQINNGKIVLTRLKDVYSQGKLAKFSLLKESKPAVIDFNGDLDIVIRVKPNQPLLKLTDKMTFSIHGNLKKPILALEQ